MEQTDIFSNLSYVFFWMHFKKSVKNPTRKSGKEKWNASSTTCKRFWKHEMHADAHYAKHLLTRPFLLTVQEHPFGPKPKGCFGMIFPYPLTHSAVISAREWTPHICMVSASSPWSFFVRATAPSAPPP